MMNTAKLDKLQLSEKIKNAKFSQAEAKEALDKIYSEATIVQKPFGETVEEIMKSQKITKKWGAIKERIDINGVPAYTIKDNIIIDKKKAEELTKLNYSVFTRMYKPNCTIDMALIISMCIGFKLSPVLAQRLLQSAGLDFRLDNPDHIAYLFLLEHCKDYTIDECNEVLEKLGVPETRRLGSMSYLKPE